MIYVLVIPQTHCTHFFVGEQIVATWGSRKHRGDAILQLTFERIGTEPMLANQGRFAVLALIVPGVILLALTVDIAVVVGWLRRL